MDCARDFYLSVGKKIDTGVTIDRQPDGLEVQKIKVNCKALEEIAALGS
jgi:myo-inositol-hexaphosphate 3-phosphohydrolase